MHRWHFAKRSLHEKRWFVSVTVQVSQEKIIGGLQVENQVAVRQEE